MTNKQRDIFTHILRGLSEIKTAKDQIDPRDDVTGFVLDLRREYDFDIRERRKRWIIYHDKLPTEYETNETADETTVDKIDKWLLEHARILDRVLTKALKKVEDEKNDD